MEGLWIKQVKLKLSVKWVGVVVLLLEVFGFLGYRKIDSWDPFPMSFPVRNVQRKKKMTMEISYGLMPSKEFVGFVKAGEVFAVYQYDVYFV